MRDKDTKLLEEIVQEKYSSLFAGKIEEDEDTSLGSDSKDDDKEKSDDSEDSKDDSSDDSKKDDDDDSGDNPFSKGDSEDSDDSDSDDSDSDDSDSGDSDSGDSGGDAAIQNKVKQLQKQYNDLLVDAFEKYAAESIETALDGVESSFGENITDILDSALQDLKGKILGDLGVEDAIAMAGDMEGGMDGEMGGMEVDIGDKPDVEFGAEVGGVPTMSVDTGNEEGEEVEEEGCGSKPAKKKIVKESVLVGNFYNMD